jgi:MoaA/NifB/PqqE/SkfB family radical SAM enzyme
VAVNIIGILPKKISLRKVIIAKALRGCARALIAKSQNSILAKVIKMPKISYFNITYRCNNDCIFCAADNGNGDNKSELPVTQFENILTEQNICAGDRIIINGGEPTVHRNFFDILEKAKAKGGYIDIYTNGVKLSSIDFVKRLSMYAPMLVRIPIFSANADLHDKLTGRKGNLEKTIKGVGNIIEMQKHANIKLEIKMLLSKATYKENIFIVDFFMNTFPDRFFFSINPLIISDRVERNSETLVTSLSAMMDETSLVIEAILKRNWNVSLGLLPFCVVPSKYHSLIPSFTPKEITEKLYADPHITQEQTLNLCSEKCRLCKYASVCPGFPEGHIKFLGDGEITPII